MNRLNVFCLLIVIEEFQDLPPIYSVSLTFTRYPLYLCLLFQCPQEKFQNLFFPNAFSKSFDKCGKILPCLMQYSKNMENDQKPRCSSCIVIEPHNFKICHPQYMVTKNIAIPAIVFSPPNLKILPTQHMEVFWVSNPN